MTAQNVAVFRCDTSPQLGQGHVQRCLALAAALHQRGMESHFVGRWEGEIQARDTFGTWQDLPQTAHDADFLAEYARRVAAKLLVLDHYGATEAYQRDLLPLAIPWLQFAGRPTQRLWARWVLAASPSANAPAYAPLLATADAKLLLGPRYAILRPAVARLHAKKRVTAQIETVVCSFGGGDDRGALSFCLESLATWRPEVKIRVLTTSANPRLPDLAARAAQHSKNRVTLSIDHPEFAGCLLEADVAIIAGGMTTFEAACLGVPALVIQIAEDQSANATAWHHWGTLEDLGKLEELTATQLVARLDSLCSDHNRRISMSEAGCHRVDGQGARRVAEQLSTGWPIKR